MRVKSILNRVEKNKPFVCERERWGKDQKELLIEMRPRAGSQPVCSGCGERGPGYDTLPERRFEFVPLWNIPVFYIYAMRRMQCQRCGVKVEKVPWTVGKLTLTRSYMQFLATWACRVSWLEVARFFHTSWEQVFRSVSWVVKWGLAHRELTGIRSLGIGLMPGATTYIARPEIGRPLRRDDGCPPASKNYVDKTITYARVILMGRELHVSERSLGESAGRFRTMGGRVSRTGLGKRREAVSL